MKNIRDILSQQYLSNTMAPIIAEGWELIKSNYPDAFFSHMCIRTQPDEYERLSGILDEQCVIDIFRDKERDIAWVPYIPVLGLTLGRKDFSFLWLEFPAPKPEKPYPTGAQMAVFCQPKLDETMKASLSNNKVVRVQGFDPRPWGSIPAKYTTEAHIKGLL